MKQADPDFAQARRSSKCVTGMVTTVPGHLTESMKCINSLIQALIQRITDIPRKNNHLSEGRKNDCTAPANRLRDLGKYLNNIEDPTSAMPSGHGWFRSINTGRGKQRLVIHCYEQEQLR